MSRFEPNNRHLREVLLFAFKSKKSAAEARRMIVDTYGEAIISERTCREWFQCFKSGDFDAEDKERPGRVKKFEDAELEALLNEDACQTQQELANSLGVTQQAISHRLKALGMIQKQGSWVPYELKPRDVERRFFTCEQLLQRQKRKGFLHRIVTGDEKWIHYDNSKRKKSWGTPAMHQHRRPSQTSMARSSCCVFGGTSSAWYIMSCCNRVKPSQELATEHN